MRAAGTIKASLIKVLREETCVTAVPNLPHQNLETAVVVDAIYAVCRCYFLKDETFGAVARLYRNHLPTDIPNGADSIHFCRDRYNHLSLKSLEQQHMPGRDKLSNLRSVGITQSPTNKSYSLYLPTRPDFLNFLCERWCDGGFKDETKSVLVTASIVTVVAALESTQQEADTRVVLHSIYSVQKEDVERIIIHTNDTDTVVISCVYYASKLLRDLSELSMWVRTARGSYLPIHGIAAAVGLSTSHALPFIHSLSERDTTSYSHWKEDSSMPIDTMALEDFVDGDQGPARITAEVGKQAK